MRRLSSLLLLAVSMAAPLSSQTAAAPAAKNCAPNRDIESLLFQSIATDQPLTSAPSRQVAAPAKDGGTTSLINGASFPEIVGLAFESGLVSTSQGVTTLDLNAFAFKALASPGVLDKQSEYESFQSWRKWGGSLSFGGKGDSFDRDGDGVADPALDAKSPSDIVNWELRYRFKGSRDRRDKDNSDQILTAAKTAFNAGTQQLHTFVFAHQKELVALASADGCFDREPVESFARDHAAELKAIVESNQEVQSKLEEAAKAIDQSRVWTVALGGVDRRKQFGPTKRTASLRFAQGIFSSQDLTANLDYTHVRGLNGDLMQSWKLGAAWSILVLKGLQKEGVKLSLSAADEYYRNVPMTHDSIVKLNAKLDFPVSKGIKIPISFTWANHRDLLTSEHEMRGHIGFTVDLSEFKKKSDS